MANVALAKPSLVATPVVSCTVFGTAGTDFYMKVARSRIRGSQKVQETSGDGDNAPAFEGNYFMVTRFKLIGFTIAQSVDTSLTLLASFLNSAKNPLSATWKLKLASSMVLTATKVLISDWDFGYDRDGATLPLMLDCVVTDSHATLGTT